MSSQRKTSTPAAADYYSDKNDVLLPDPTISADQPASTPTNHFGLQPQGLKDIDKEPQRKVLIIAAGDVWTRFVRWVFEHRGTEVYVFDPALIIKPGDTPERIAEVLKRREKAGFDEAHVLKSLDDVPADINYAVNLTTAEWHSYYIKWAQERGIPMMVEKPLVEKLSELTDPDGLNNLMLHPKAPLYCMDWMPALALPLAAAIGRRGRKKVPFANAVIFEGKSKFRKFDFRHIVEIKGSRIKGMAPDAAREMDFIRENRPSVYAQGIARDMGVHVMAALACLGFMPGDISDITLGSTEGQTEFGVYRRIGEEDTPAWYALAKLKSIFRGRKIPTTIEVAKDGAVDDSHITLTDRHGNTLRWEYGYGKDSKVTLRNKKGQVLATAVSKIDPYALMVEQATQFFDEQESAPRKQALYFQEHRQVLGAIERIEQEGRLKPVEPGTEIVMQSALEKQMPGAVRGSNIASVLQPDGLHH